MIDDTKVSSEEILFALIIYTQLYHIKNIFLYIYIRRNLIRTIWNMGQVYFKKLNTSGP